MTDEFLNVIIYNLIFSKKGFQEAGRNEYSNMSW